MKDFEEYLRECKRNGITEFRVVYDALDDGSIYIHPLDKNGESMDFEINKNELIAKN